MKKQHPKNTRRRFHLPERGRRGLLTALSGRSLLVVLLLMLQVTLLIGLFMRWQYASYAYGGTYIVSFVMSLWLINHSGNSAAKQTWLILVMLAPVVGTLLYLFVELDIGHRLVHKRLEQIQRDTSRLLPGSDSLTCRLKTEEHELYALSRYIGSACGLPVCENTRVSYFPSGEKKFAAMLEALEKAEKFIFLEYFIIDEGHMWNTILEILRRKAAQGVDVRVMYDGTCALFRLPYRYPETLRAMGIQCKMFSPLRPLVSTHYNNRDHRKILVIDGHTAFTGGINLADEYINEKQLFGHWKDTAVMLQGEAARSFTLMFLQMWHITERDAEYDRFLSAPLPPLPPTEGYVIPYCDNPFDRDRAGESVYLDIIGRADRYVHIMTPYLIIDSEMTTALCLAARRGVDVRLILPHIPDKKSAFSLAYTHYQELLSHGVRIFEYTPGFVHAKTFVSDDKKAVVGTINLDYRSLYLHFECAVYLYKTSVITEIEQDFQNTLNACREITPEILRTEKSYRMLLGALLKPFSPLM